MQEKTMNMFYIAFVRFPTEKAHGKQIKEMCNALSDSLSVTLIVPKRKTKVPLSSFGLNAKVRVVCLPLVDFVPSGTRLGFWVSYLQFIVLSGMYMFWQKLTGKHPRMLTRDYVCALFPALLRIPTIWESHRGEWNWVTTLVAKLGVRFVVITQALKDLYLKKGVSVEQITVAPDGVDLSRYTNLPSKSEARAKLGLDQNKCIALYNGHLHTWKGVETLAEAAAQLPPEYEVIFMGGTDDDIEAFRTKYGHIPQISIIGRKDDQERPVYLRAVDVLMLPNTAKDEISVKYTSPLKLFGYMAAGTPIIASDLPSIREVVSEKKVFFAEPDNPRSFSSVIQYACIHRNEAAEKSKSARKLVQDFSWERRVQKILLQFILKI